MTRRERVETTLNHKEADRVPVDMTIVTKPYQEILEYYGEEDDLWCDDWAHVFPKPEILEKLNIDVMHLPFGKSCGQEYRDKNEFLDEWGCKKVRVTDEYGGFLFQMVDHPLKDAESIEDIENYDHWPALDEERLEGFEKEVKYLYDNTDFALTMVFGGNVFERAHYLRGMENFFVDLLTEPEMAQAMMKKVLEINLHRDKQIFERVGKYLTYMRFQGEDMGSQDAPLLSLQTFQTVIRPYLEQEWKAAKAEYIKHNPQGKISVHSCGAIFDFIPDFIDMGADMLNPIQPNAAGMNTKLINTTYGDKLCFHGAVDSQDVLVHGTIEDIRNEVRTRMADLKPGGGYIMAPSHNIQSGISAEKIVALYDAAQEFGQYK